MPKRYAREFRRSACERLVAGEKVTSLSKELGVSEATLYLVEAPGALDRRRATRGREELRGRRVGPGLQDHRRARGRYGGYGSLQCTRV